jgi:hypothetical protein
MSANTKPEGCFFLDSLPELRKTDFDTFNPSMGF